MRFDSFLKLSATLLIFIAMFFLVSVSFPRADIGAAAPLDARISVRGQWRLVPTTLTITGSQTITPTESDYLLNNVSVLTLTLSEGAALPGDRLRFMGLVLTETEILTNNTNLAATILISQNDVVDFEYFGGHWVEVINKGNAAD